mmetsp:Transcript_6350/g.17229  ORF Transcript_6350/g.17229 Transcript_6350/m.17229 type:complete len:298 (+) Transcript_6350:316-1209(+)
MSLGAAPSAPCSHSSKAKARPCSAIFLHTASRLAPTQLSSPWCSFNALSVPSKSVFTVNAKRCPFFLTARTTRHTSFSRSRRLLSCKNSSYSLRGSVARSLPISAISFEVGASLAPWVTYARPSERMFWMAAITVSTQGSAPCTSKLCIGLPKVMASSTKLSSQRDTFASTSSNAESGLMAEIPSIVSDRRTTLLPLLPIDSITPRIISAMWPSSPPRSCWKGNGCMTASGSSSISTRVLRKPLRHRFGKSVELPPSSSAACASAVSISRVRALLTSACFALDAAAKRSRSNARTLL